nr:MAG TPA: hypothetical protein [Caudoviricetes sp.]
MVVSLGMTFFEYYSKKFEKLSPSSKNNKCRD